MSRINNTNVKYEIDGTIHVNPINEDNFSIADNNKKGNLKKTLLKFGKNKKWIDKLEKQDNITNRTSNCLRNVNKYKTEKNLNFISSKTIYSLHFEQIPNNNGKLIEGIDVNFSCPFYVEIERVKEYEKNDIFSIVRIKNVNISLKICILI